jgi:hypothetical protein
MLNTIASFGVETWTKNTVWNFSRPTNLKYMQYKCNKWGSYLTKSNFTLSFPIQSLLLWTKLIIFNSLLLLLFLLSMYFLVANCSFFVVENCKL